MVMRVNTMGGVSALPVAGSALYAANGQLFLAGASQVGVFDLATQVRTDIAGLGSFHFSGDGGPATLARLHGPYALAAGNSGDFFVADLLNRRVRRIDAAGQITTVAGNGSTALFDEISGLAVDASGVLWIADRAAHCLWKLGASGQLTLAAGTGKPEFKGDNGPASSASLNAPHALAFDRNGNLFVADAGNGRVRKITPGGWISTVVAGLSEPRGLGFDAAGDLYIAETAAGRVERLTAKGALESVASGLRAPRGISIGSDGTVFVAAGGAGQVVALGAGGTPIPLVADAGFQAPMDVLVLPNGSLLVADFGTGLIRRLVPQTAPITLLPQLHILHAATNLEGAVAPGEIVSVYGSGFFGDCALLASATPAWLLYVGSTQINAVLPNELQPGEAATLQAVCGGTPVGEAAVTVAAANPGLFADNGRAAALNQDGTVNSSTYPATQGSIISLFGTGLGAAHAATVTIAGYDTAVLYAGPAPGLPGVFQVNARVPAVSGDAEVRVTAGGVPSPSGVTLAVR